MFVHFIHKWYFTRVRNRLQQNSTSPPDISTQFKVYLQTLANNSISSYAKNEEIIPDQFNIYPFVMQPNHYLNMPQCNLVVKKLRLRRKFNKKSKKPTQEISFFS